MLLSLLFCLVFLGLNSSKAHGATQVIGGTASNGDIRLEISDTGITAERIHRKGL